MSLRPVDEDADLAFLYRVYESTRQQELSLLEWPQEQKQAFVEQQFAAQHEHYRRHYREAERLVILVAGEPAGRLYISRWPQEIRLVDIALLPEHRGQGIGGALVRRLLEEAAASGLPVTIHVERFNPALNLYQRLGFQPISEQGPYLLMRWQAAAPS